MLEILLKPKDGFEKRTAEYLQSIITAEDEARIAADKKLTLDGCWKFCHDKGRKLAVNGCADISPELEQKWIREYFGIKGDIPRENTEEKKSVLNLDFSIFDE